MQLLIIQRGNAVARTKLAAPPPRTDKIALAGKKLVHLGCARSGGRIMDRYIMQVLPWPRTVILGCVGGHLHAGIISDGASGVGHHEWGGRSCSYKSFYGINYKK